MKYVLNPGRLPSSDQPGIWTSKAIPSKAEPFDLGQPDAPYAVLCVHGLAGDPSAYRTLAQLLANAGFRVRVILLPGHGTQVEDLAKTPYEAWIKWFEKEFIALAEKHSAVHVVGHSMGGLLGLDLATDQPAKLEKLVVAATPYSLPLWSGLAVQAFANKAVAKLVGTVPLLLGPGIRRREAKADVMGYKSMPVTAILQLEGLRLDVLKRLDQVSTRVLLLTAAHDRTISKDSGSLLAAALGNNVEEWINYPRSAHVLTEDFDRFKIAEHIISFFQS